MPFMTFSSRSSFFSQARILALASLVLTMLSQSREGPWEACEVMTSTKSPVSRELDRGTMRPLTLAPMQRLPTAEWMR